MVCLCVSCVAQHCLHVHLQPNLLAWCCLHHMSCWACASPPAGLACVLPPPNATQLDITACQLADVCVSRPPGAAGGPGPVAPRQRRAHLTPPEPVLVAEGCSVSQLKAAVRDAFAAVYRLARHWRCDSLTGLPPGCLRSPAAAAAERAAAAAVAGDGDGSEGAAGGAAGAATEAAPPAAAGVAASGGSGAVGPDGLQLVGRLVPRGTLLTASGPGLDPEPRCVCLCVGVWVCGCVCGCVCGRLGGNTCRAHCSLHAPRGSQCVQPTLNPQSIAHARAHAPPPGFGTLAALRTGSCAACAASRTTTASA
jgi:hypothetical protein